MKVGFDISQTGAGKAGCGYYAHSIIESLIKNGGDLELTLFPHFGDFYFDPKIPAISSYVGRGVTHSPHFLTREKSSLFWNADNLDLALGSLDIIHANNFWCPSQAISSRLIYTLYDLSFLVNPSWTTEVNRLGCFKGVLEASISADWIVAISEFSKNEFLKFFPYFPAEHIKVIYPASRFLSGNRTDFKPKKLCKLSSGNFWLSVSTIEPRKNQRTLLSAYVEYLKLGGDRIPLVFAGGDGWLMDDFRSEIKRMEIESDVILTGYVSDDELIWLYRNCYANLYPSFYEGFGLPVLEGMQFGAPSIISNASSLPEVGGHAATYVSPEKIMDWATSMYGLRKTPLKRNAMSANSVKQASKFDWRISTQSILDLYGSALALPKRANKSS